MMGAVRRRKTAEHFLMQEQTEQVSYSPGRGDAQPEREYYGSAAGARMPPANAAAAASSSSLGLNAKARVARLLDSYLSEVSRDRNLSLTKFQVLALESMCTCDDGLYRAVDSYLKAHSVLTEHERKRLCRVDDCQKLSFDACMHAAQNERLPLRAVVHVLFSEQVKISNALAGSSAAPDGGATSGAPTTRWQLLDDAAAAAGPSAWSNVWKKLGRLAQS